MLLAGSVVQSCFQELEIQAQFHLAKSEPAECRKRVFLFVVQFAGFTVNHAKGTESKPVIVDQWRAGIKANMGLLNDQRIFAEARVLQSVRDDEEVTLLDGVGADGTFAGGFGHLNAKFGFEPLSVIVYQGEHGDGNLTNMGGNGDQVVKRLLGFGVENGVTIEQIGMKYDLTKERIRQIKERAIKRLQKARYSNALKAYLG